MAKKKYRYVRVAVPLDDEVSCAWLDEQASMSLSVRMLIRDACKRHGLRDVFASDVGAWRANSSGETGKRKRGRPRKEVSGGAQEGAKRDAETAEAPMAAVPVAEEVDMGRIDKPVRAKKTAGGPPAIQMDESVLDSIGLIDDDIMNMMSK